MIVRSPPSYESVRELPLITNEKLKGFKSYRHVPKDLAESGEYFGPAEDMLHAHLVGLILRMRLFRKAKKINVASDRISFIYGSSRTHWHLFNQTHSKIERPYTSENYKVDDACVRHIYIQFI